MKLIDEFALLRSTKNRTILYKTVNPIKNTNEIKEVII